MTYAINILTLVKKHIKAFSLAFIIPIALVSILATILPKKKNSFELIPDSQRYDVENKLASIKPSSNADVVKKSTSIYDIEKAISSNKISELTILRMDELGDDIISQETFIPQVKKILLARLQSLMTLEDWQLWRENIQLPYSSRSRARIFVDNISTVNFYLGRYLETAGLLLSALYISTSRHSIFNLEESLYNLLEESNAIFSVRKPTAISSRVYIDTLITEDSVFSDYFQKVRAKLVLSTIQKREKDIDNSFLLLSSIPAKYFSGEIIEKYVNLITKVTNSVSPRLREEIRAHYLSPELAKILSDANGALGDATRNLYAKSIEYLLETNQPTKARAIYLQLASFTKSKEFLDAVKGTIDSKMEGVSNTLPEPISDQPSKIDPLTSKLFSDEYHQSIASSSSFEWYSLIFALGLFIAIIFKSSRTFVLNSIVWISGFFLQRPKRNKDNETTEVLSNELHESIKAGKTVPMADIAKNRAANLKKAANN